MTLELPLPSLPAPRMLCGVPGSPALTLIKLLARRDESPVLNFAEASETDTVLALLDAEGEHYVPGFQFVDGLHFDPNIQYVHAMVFSRLQEYYQGAVVIGWRPDQPTQWWITSWWLTHNPQVGSAPLDIIISLRKWSSTPMKLLEQLVRVMLQDHSQACWRPQQ